MAESGALRQRIHDEPGFLLHTVPWRETSLIAEVLSRHHGRVALVAKGARRARSGLHAVLLGFQPLRLAWSGRGELRNLTAAEWVGGFGAPQAEGLMCAFYLNELLMRLLPRDDPHPQLYDAYQQALLELGELDTVAAQARPVRAEREECLRRFEWILLRESGYAPDLQHDAEGEPTRGEAWYRWSPEGGFRIAEPGATATSRPDSHAGALGPEAVSGAALQGLANGVLDSDGVRRQAKRLTRSILGYYLEGKALKTRQLLRELQAHDPGRSEDAES
ncbi:MAG: DNA repair protein RecO [Betaproteobacteria bacterium]